MANQPIFVASWRQDFATLLAGLANAAQDILTPGASGTRIHAVALANDGDVLALVELGAYDVVGEDVSVDVSVDVAAGTNADADPFTVTRDSGEWSELDAGLVLTIAAGTAAHRGDYELQSRTDTVLTFANTPGNTIATVSGDTVSIHRWRPLWSVTVPPRAGYDGYPAVSGLDPVQMPWLDAAGDRWLLVTGTLAGRLPGNANDTVTGNVHVTVFAGDC